MMFIDRQVSGRAALFSVMLMMLAGCSTLDEFGEDAGPESPKAKVTRLSAKKSILLSPDHAGSQEMKLYIMRGS